MNLNELKESMSTLDDILAQKSVEPITFNTSSCNTARKKIMKQFRQGVISDIIIAIVFIIAWNAGLGKDAFTLAYKLYLVIFLALGAVWYGFLYFKTKKINIAMATPIQTMKQVASLRLYTLVGEIVFGMAMVVFFTLFLSTLWVVGKYRFWIIISAIVVFLIVLVSVLLPRTIRNFRNLTTTE